MTDVPKRQQRRSRARETSKAQGGPPGSLEWRLWHATATEQNLLTFPAGLRVRALPASCTLASSARTRHPTTRLSPRPSSALASASVWKYTNAFLHFQFIESRQGKNTRREIGKKREPTPAPTAPGQLRALPTLGVLGTTATANALPSPPLAHPILPTHTQKHEVSNMNATRKSDQATN